MATPQPPAPRYTQNTHYPRLMYSPSTAGSLYYTRVYTQTRTHTHTHTHMYIHVRVCTYLSLYIHTYILTYILTYIRTYIQTGNIVGAYKVRARTDNHVDWWSTLTLIQWGLYHSKITSQRPGLTHQVIHCMTL